MWFALRPVLMARPNDRPALRVWSLLLCHRALPFGQPEQSRSPRSLKTRLCAALGAAVVGLTTPLPSAGGISSAEAGEFYSRKRVNGKWITGHFRRKAVVPTTPAELTTDAAAGASSEVESTSAFRDVPTSDDDRLLPLRRGLTARAAMMAAALEPGAVPPRIIRSLTIDYESHLKIIVFLDGSRPLERTVIGSVNAKAVP